jgi:hypothetical protein
LLRKKINVYVIGGAVLLEQGLKTATKDVDIIVESKKDFLAFQEALEEFGFIKKIPEK